MPERDNTPVTEAAPTDTTTVTRRESVATLDGDTIVIPTHVDGLPLRFTRTQKHLDADQMRLLGPLGIEADYDLGEVIAFLVDCRKRGFDPYAKEAMLYRIAGKYIRHVGIEGLRRKAEETREYRGQAPPMFCGPDGVWKDVWTSEQPPLAAKVGVYRAGFVEAVSRPVFWDEYCPMQAEKVQDRTGRWVPTGKRVPIANWKPANKGGKPLVMLVKVAEATSLRAAWPNTFSGYYVPEETAKMRVDEIADLEASKEAEAARDAAAERRRAAYTKANPPPVRERVIDGEAVDTTPTAGDDDRRGELARAELAWQAGILGKDLDWITRRWRAARGGQDFATATAQEAVELTLRYRPVVAEALRNAGQDEQADRYANAGDRIAPLEDLLSEDGVRP
jgi:hypothetical protein